MEMIVHGTNPKFGFFSGLHGDETSIIPSLHSIIEHYQSQLGSYVFLPHCSPSAIALGTRKNAEGLDLNRSFIKHPHSLEVKDIITALQPYTFEQCVDFHEDTQVAGVYIYDHENREGSKILEIFRQRIRQIAPLYSGIDDEVDQELGSMVSEGYHASAPPAKDLQGDYLYKGFIDYWALIEGKTKHWMTLEVPTQLLPEQKKAVIDIFFKTFIL